MGRKHSNQTNKNIFWSPKSIENTQKRRSKQVCFNDFMIPVAPECVCTVRIETACNPAPFSHKHPPNSPPTPTAQAQA